jgi:hypothetical protein
MHIRVPHGLGGGGGGGGGGGLCTVSDVLAALVTLTFNELVPTVISPAPVAVNVKG